METITDRKLLKLAAKAIGLDHHRVGDEIWIPQPGGTGEFVLRWNPLTNDGDALRLAVKLELSLDLFHDGVTVAWTTAERQFPQIVESTNTDDPYANTRRAIVRAAAEIGKSMA